MFWIVWFKRQACISSLIDMPLLDKFSEAKSLVKSAVPGNTFEPTEFDDKYKIVSLTNDLPNRLLFLLVL